MKHTSSFTYIYRKYKSVLIIKKEENFFKEWKANESMLKGHPDELTFDLNLTFTDEIYSEKKRNSDQKFHGPKVSGFMATGSDWSSKLIDMWYNGEFLCWV